MNRLCRYGQIKILVKIPCALFSFNVRAYHRLRLYQVDAVCALRCNDYSNVDNDDDCDDNCR